MNDSSPLPTTNNACDEREPCGAFIAKSYRDGQAS